MFSDFILLLLIFILAATEIDICSQTSSTSAFLPSINVCNLILGPIILLGVVIHFP